jgi:hypothetical protein
LFLRFTPFVFIELISMEYLFSFEGVTTFVRKEIHLTNETNVLLFVAIMFFGSFVFGFLNQSKERVRTFNAKGL